MSRKFDYDVTVPKGAPLNDPSNPDGRFLLVVEKEIPFWDELRSYEFGVYRNGAGAHDISTYSMGVSRDKGGKLKLKFQLLDRNVDTIQACDYRVHATFNFD
ncbi:MAG: hypothetical protein U1E30_12395 [Rhodoblastus sp.]